MKADKKKTGKKNLTRIVFVIVLVVIGFLFGAFMAEYIDSFLVEASILRTEYTYALLSGKDTVEADKIKVAFEKIASRYPYPQEIDNERELMNYSEQIIQQL